ncbi:hypothetical protein [Deinococcus aquatilis]|nr:hypothetical protein [Deinococcus aquatilis]
MNELWGQGSVEIGQWSLQKYRLLGPTLPLSLALYPTTEAAR